MAKQFIRKERKYKINEDIHYNEVRLIGDNPVIISSAEALNIAESLGKDLILINESSKPPIVRIENYGKFIYEQEKREKEAKKVAHKTEMKEISLSIAIADHDLGIKAKKASEFLEDGDKVKLSLMMKGRQNKMKEQGELVLLKFAKLVENSGLPEFLPKLEGNKWNMILKPKKK